MTERDEGREVTEELGLVKREGRRKVGEDTLGRKERWAIWVGGNWGVWDGEGRGCSGRETNKCVLQKVSVEGAGKCHVL